MESSADLLSADEDYPLRALFPVTEELIYLNHAAVGPLCRPAAEAVVRYVHEQSRRGMDADMGYFGVIESARERLGQLINASPEDIAWTANTSVSISTVAQGIDWRAGDNVVVADEQFPANVYPWMEVARDGVETRLAKREGAGTPLENIAALMDERTRLVAVSWVEFNSGYRYDLKALADMCHQRGALLVVDVIQGLGALQLDVQATGVDFVCGALHKWMLGPQGIGILYIRHGLIDQLRARFANWRSVVNPFDQLNYRQDWIGNARRFEPSTMFMMGQIAADEALKVILDAGPAEIERRVLAHAQLIADRLREHGHQLVGPGDPVGSGVVCFIPRNETPEAVVQRLSEHRISIAARSGVARVSAHYYNTTAEIESIFAPGLLG